VKKLFINCIFSIEYTRALYISYKNYTLLDTIEIEIIILKEIEDLRESKNT